MSDTFSFKIEVFTDSLLIAGSYDLPLYRRICDALNSRLHRFVTLRDASVAPIWKPQQSQRIPQVLVNLDSALLVAVIEEPQPPPDFLPTNLFRDTQPMMFFTSAFALRADFVKRSDMEIVTLLSELNDDFISLSSAAIFPLNGGMPLNRVSVSLSRAHIQALFAIALPPAPAVAEMAATDTEAPPVSAEQLPSEEGEAQAPAA